MLPAAPQLMRDLASALRAPSTSMSQGEQRTGGQRRGHNKCPWTSVCGSGMCAVICGFRGRSNLGVRVRIGQCGTKLQHHRTGGPQEHAEPYGIRFVRCPSQLQVASRNYAAACVRDAAAGAVGWPRPMSS